MGTLSVQVKSCDPLEADQAIPSHMQKDSSVQILGWLEGKSGVSGVALSIPTTREVKAESLEGQSRILRQSAQLSEALSKRESQRGLRM